MVPTGIRWIVVPTGMSVKIWSKSSDLILIRTGEIEPPGESTSTSLGRGSHVADSTWFVEAATILSTDFTRGPPGIFCGLQRRMDSCVMWSDVRTEDIG